MDEHTVWSICSNTKLITVFALALLVEAGKLQWESKLCDLVPELDLRDKHANSTLTLEHVLSRFWHPFVSLFPYPGHAC